MQLYFKVGIELFTIYMVYSLSLKSSFDLNFLMILAMD